MNRVCGHAAAQRGNNVHGHRLAELRLEPEVRPDQ